MEFQDIKKVSLNCAHVDSGSGYYRNKINLFKGLL